MCLSFQQACTSACPCAACCTSFVPSHPDICQACGMPKRLPCSPLLYIWYCLAQPAHVTMSRKFPSAAERIRSAMRLCTKRRGAATRTAAPPFASTTPSLRLRSSAAWLCHLRAFTRTAASQPQPRMLMAAHTAVVATLAPLLEVPLHSTLWLEHPCACPIDIASQWYCLCNRALPRCCWHPCVLIWLPAVLHADRIEY